MTSTVAVAAGGSGSRPASPPSLASARSARFAEPAALAEGFRRIAAAPEAAGRLPAR